MLEIITSSNAPAPVGAYSQAVCFKDLVFVSGQLPLNSAGEMPSDISDQTTQSLKNIEAILAEKKLSKTNVIKVQIFTCDLSAFELINHQYQLFFGSHAPARAVVEVSALPKGALVEIDAIAFCEE